MRNAFLALVLVFSPSALAKTVDGTVAFKGETMGGLVDLRGTGAHVTGDVQFVNSKAVGTFTVALKDLTTGLDLRDEHMKNKYLEVEKFPTAKLVLKPWAVTSTESDFEGDLTIKGQTKPVHGKAKVDGGKLSAGFTVKLSDYPAIGVVGFKGIAVKDEIAVSVEGTN